MSHKLFIYFYFLLAAFLVSPVLTFGAEPHPLSEELLSQGLPEKWVGEWRASGPSRRILAEKIPESADAKILTEYGLQSITERQYSNGKAYLSVKLFEMKYASGAYGLWTFQRGALPANQKELFNGRFVIQFSATDQLAIESVVSKLQSNLPSEAEIPLLPSYLPEQSKIADTEKYVSGPEVISRIPSVSDLKEFIDFTGGTHAAIADYINGNGKMSILLVEFQSPQFAVDGLAKIQQHFNALSPEAQSKRIVRRVGNYAVEAVNVSDTKAAEEVLKQIKYMVQVHWEGKNVRDIPLPFRPPDPAAIREAVQSGQFIVAAFYWIGVLIMGAMGIGIIAGGAFFYWRRAQRRRRGLGNSFSDAGGMTRLNLDEYLLQGSDASANLLGKGE